MNRTLVAENVVYGVCSGAALLLDVHRPADARGIGVVYVPGSAWHGPLAYGASQLKALETGVPFVDAFNQSFVNSLLEHGYTVFVLNHRQAPRFRHPAAVEDCRRAVRFIRHHAAEYAIAPNAIGGVGYSSGAHMVSLLGLMDGAGDPESQDPVERESAAIQCVVAGATPADLTDLSAPLLAPAIASYLGALTFFAGADSEEVRTAVSASPIHHVSERAAPHLLFHGDRDEVIPFSHSERLAARLGESGAAVELVTIGGGTHMNTRPPEGPDYLRAMLDWFGTHLPLAGRG